jgi:hypothetical protein
VKAQIVSLVRSSSVIGWGLIFALLLVSFLYLPTASGNLGLDASYLRALCQASRDGLVLR